MINFKLKTGQSLVELLLAIGLSSIFLPALITGLIASREGKPQQAQRLEAVAILKETQEAVRSVREKGWTIFANNGTFHTDISGSSWTLAPGATTSGDFTQQVVISDVYRNTLSGPIVDQGNPGAVLDPSTKKVVTTISWNKPIIASVTSTMYLTRYLENASYTETTQDDFNYVGRLLPGVKSGVTVRATNPPLVPNDGEIILGAGGYGNWCAPTLLNNAVDVPGQGTQKAITAITGHAYIGTGGNASGDSLDHFTITNPSPPATPSATLSGSYNNYKSYGIFGDSSYAYLTSDHPNLTLDIVQITNLPYTQVGTANAGSAGINIYVQNSIGFVTTADNKLYTFNFQNINGAHSPIGNVALAGKGVKVVVVGNYAYVAIGSTTNQLQIIEVSNNGTTLNVVKNISVPGLDAKDLFISGNRAYLATALSTDKKEFFIIDIDPTSATYGQVRGSYDTNGMDPTGVTVVPGNIAVIGGTGAETYQVLSITFGNTQDTPSRCGGLTLPNGWGIYGLASILDSQSRAFTYILTNDISNEFKMIEGGPGGSYSANGEFESATLNPGYTTVNNRFMANFSAPSGTSIQFQVTMANLVTTGCPVGQPSCCPTTGGYTFVGFDGSPGTKSTLVSGQSYTFPFTGSGNYSNPGQCIRYKAYFSTSSPSNTPVLNDVTINYSP